MDKYAARAKEIISKILYITVATATKDGIPWNSPLYSAFDEDYNFYWVSDQNGQHSKNIEENDKVFLAIYDSTVPEGTGEGVYIQAKAHKLTDEDDIQKALGHLYRRIGKDPHKREASEFLGNYPQRIYKAVLEKVWINDDGKVNGNYIDIRREIKKEK